jgi:uncharacterized membrane protein
LDTARRARENHPKRMIACRSPNSSASDDAAGGRPADHRCMPIGPVQLLVLGFGDARFHGEIVRELERLRENGAVRVIDALAVYKDADGELEVAHLSNLPDAEVGDLGRLVSALVGLEVEGEPALDIAADAGETAAGEQESWDVLDDIPRNSAAALLLIEHHWAVPLHDAIRRAGGFRIGDGFISPLDLAAIGLVSAEQAEELLFIESGTVT